MTEVKVFVYGSCHFSERFENDEKVGNGGFGVVISKNGKKDEVSAGYSNTTNSRMDLMGIIEGLKRVKEPGNVTVYLTNGYVIDSLSKGWLEKWKRNGFKKIKHADLWVELNKVLSSSSHSVSFRHTKEVKYSPDLNLAEQLAKAMSSKRNLPADIKLPLDKGLDLFTPTEKNIEITGEKLEIIEEEIILDSICVDASSLQNAGPTEYRGVDTKTKRVIFEMKYGEATNNIGEFLVIVHALALFKKEGKELKVIYSDSSIAISWVKQKICKTKYEKTESNTRVFEHIQRAENWLENNQYDTKILKWNTVAWGEIPADYGQK